ncbi:scavenger receptor cysteine-rich domain-containing protein DMBT1-like [Petaurus breviceps papuanus]|uniref:scavenger receptor cysteine-rich domain-containing protein DMBT1-like n=1 Tax=Petaurus breviceps papuanus TaxID=3040969 RepID=UPI0036DAF917
MVDDDDDDAVDDVVVDDDDDDVDDVVVDDDDDRGLSCSTEYVEVFDGTPTSRSLGKVCNGLYLTYQSSSNIMTVVFFRNSSQSSTWFDGYYYAELEAPTSITVPTTLSCTEDQMYAAVSEQYLQSLGYSVQNLSVYNSSCEPEVISNYIIFSIPFNGCGTVMQETDDTIIYSNVISTNQSRKVISRLKNFHLHLSCRMNKNIMVEVKYLADDSIDITRHQYGHYGLQVSFYESPLFEHPVIESPYYVQLNQDVFFQLMLRHFDPNLVLSVDTCVASPYADDFKTITYDLIRHGCVSDPTYTAYSSSNPNVVKFKFNAFKFLKQHDAVYLKCQMVICRADDASSKCLQGCTFRSKREIHPEWDNLDVVLGPVRLQRETSLEKKTGNWNSSVTA